MDLRASPEARKSEKTFLSLLEYWVLIFQGIKSTFSELYDKSVQYDALDQATTVDCEILTSNLSSLTALPGRTSGFSASQAYCAERLFTSEFLPYGIETRLNLCSVFCLRKLTNLVALCTTHCRGKWSVVQPRKGPAKARCGLGKWFCGEKWSRQRCVLFGAVFDFVGVAPYCSPSVRQACRGVRRFELFDGAVRLYGGALHSTAGCAGV